MKGKLESVISSIDREQATKFRLWCKHPTGIGLNVFKGLFGLFDTDPLAKYCCVNGGYKLTSIGFVQQNAFNLYKVEPAMSVNHSRFYFECTTNANGYILASMLRQINSVKVNADIEFNVILNRGIKGHFIDTSVLNLCECEDGSI